MPNIEEIRLYMKSWKKMTYKQGLDRCFEIKKDIKVYNITIEVLRLQHLENKFMDGNSVQKIPIKDEGKIDIIFSDIFWELTNRYISPASYVGEIVKKCVQSNIINANKIAGIVGRGLRAFPSFLREMDLTNKIKKYYKEAKIFNNPLQDVRDHTDILIRSGDQAYRIWSYQNFKNGLNNTASRLKGDRGIIPDGIHVLCPIDIRNNFESEEVEGWYFYSEQYVKTLHEMIEKKDPYDYEALLKLDNDTLKKYLRTANQVKK